MMNFILSSFKPCYKWNTFNTEKMAIELTMENVEVLNLVISGIPSILCLNKKGECYIWMF